MLLILRITLHCLLLDSHGSLPVLALRIEVPITTKTKTNFDSSTYPAHVSATTTNNNNNNNSNNNKSNHHGLGSLRPHKSHHHVSLSTHQPPTASSPGSPARKSRPRAADPSAHRWRGTTPTSGTASFWGSGKAFLKKRDRGSKA